MSERSEATSTAQLMQISEGRCVGAAPAYVWSILGDFGNEHIWASQLKDCRRDTETVRVGTVRACTLAKPLMGRADVEEQLIDFDPGKTLSYRLRGGAGPFRSAEGRWSIRPDVDGTFVEVSGRFEPRNAVIAALLGGLARVVAVQAARRALADLAAYVERGRESVSESA